MQMSNTIPQLTGGDGAHKRNRQTGITYDILEGYDLASQTSPLFPNQDDMSYTSHMKGSERTTKLMRLVGYIFSILSITAVIITVPTLTIKFLAEKKLKVDEATLISAGTFVLVTIIISFYGIYMHLTNYYMPGPQKYVIRILFMVPLYSVASLMSLELSSFKTYIIIARDLYEAFVISSFIYLIIELLGGESGLSELLSDKDEHLGQHVFPANYILRNWEMGEDFMFECKLGALQYVVIKVLCTIVAAILMPLHLYGESLSLYRGYFYTAFAINISQMYALYCLVMLYHATHDNLREPTNWNPLGKFACVKGVIFFTWWQTLLIDILHSQHVIPSIGQWDANKVAVALRDYLIVVEMFFFAVAHTFTYTYKEYSTPDDRLRDDIADFENDDYTSPLIRKLIAPMKVSEALWSSSVPSETLDDINRLKGGTSKVKSKPIGITVNVQHAESI